MKMVCKVISLFLSIVMAAVVFLTQCVMVYAEDIQDAGVELSKNQNTSWLFVVIPSFLVIVICICIILYRTKRKTL